MTRFLRALALIGTLVSRLGHALDVMLFPVQSVRSLAPAATVVRSGRLRRESLRRSR